MVWMIGLMAGLEEGHSSGKRCTGVMGRREIACGRNLHHYVLRESGASKVS